MQPPPIASIYRGHPGTVQLQFRVASGLHINSNQPKEEYLKKTELKLDAPTDITIERVIYPDGEDRSFPFAPDEKINVYSGDFPVEVVLHPLKSVIATKYAVLARPIIPRKSPPHARSPIGPEIAPLPSPPREGSMKKLLGLLLGITLVALPLVFRLTACHAAPAAAQEKEKVADDNSTALTIYNQNFFVAREHVPLDLQSGVNQAEYAGIAAHLEPDSVILHDPNGRALQILEQNYRNDPVSPEMLLSFYEGKTI